MSARNLFIIKSQNIENAKKIYSQLDEYMMPINYSIIFEPKGYWDEILDLLDCDSYYFTITNGKNIKECDNIFDTEDSFCYAIKFPKKQFEAKEYEFLYKKLSFFNNIVEIVFRDDNVEAIEFYISDQYSIDLNDFNWIIEVVDGRLSEALIETFKPTRKNKYFGMKAVKFVIKR